MQLDVELLRSPTYRLSHLDSLRGGRAFFLARLSNPSQPEELQIEFRNSIFVVLNFFRVFIRWARSGIEVGPSHGSDLKALNDLCAAPR